MPEAELRNLELWEDLQSGVQRLSGPDSGQNEVEDADEDKPSTPSFSSRTREQAHGLNPRNTSRPQFLSPHILPTTQSPKPPTETPPPPLPPRHSSSPEPPTDPENRRAAATDDSLEDPLGSHGICAEAVGEAGPGLVVFLVWVDVCF